MVQIGVLKESRDDRVSLTPNGAKKLKKLDVEIILERGAGKLAGFDDAMYQEQGVTVSDRSEVLASSDLIVSIYPIADAELSSLPAGKALVGLYQPYQDKSMVDKLNQHQLIGLSLDMIPRTTLAQQMDVLSSMGSVAGYQAVLEAARLLPRFFPMMITAAGSIKPAKVLVLGAGVAGLQAIATAKRLGAVVEAFDVRSAAKEEVESLGARFIEVAGAKDDADAGGYAVEQTAEYRQKQGALIQTHAKEADVVITTAQLRGKPAPKLIETATVQAMKPGSVIVDLAAATGGNCELTQNGETIFTEGVHIIGDSNLAAAKAQNASDLFSNNLVQFLQLILAEGQLNIDRTNEIVGAACFTNLPDTPQS